MLLLATVPLLFATKVLTSGKTPDPTVPPVLDA